VNNLKHIRNQLETGPVSLVCIYVIAVSINQGEVKCHNLSDVNSLIDSIQILQNVHLMKWCGVHLNYYFSCRENVWLKLWIVYADCLMVNSHVVVVT
jgi:hypothetical protein